MDSIIQVPPALADYEDEQDPEVRGAWAISTLASADWALMRLAECEAEAEEIEAQAEAARARIAARVEVLKAKALRGASFFRLKLEDYAVTHRKELLLGSKKSREFVHGRIQFRSKAERLKVTDKAALEAWLAAQPVEDGLYRMKLEPEMRALQERFKESGEIPPGCDVELATETIQIDAEAPETALAKE